MGSECSLNYRVIFSRLCYCVLMSRASGEKIYQNKIYSLSLPAWCPGTVFVKEIHEQRAAALPLTLLRSHGGFGFPYSPQCFFVGTVRVPK